MTYNMIVIDDKIISQIDIICDKSINNKIIEKYSPNQDDVKDWVKNQINNYLDIKFNYYNDMYVDSKYKMKQAIPSNTSIPHSSIMRIAKSYMDIIEDERGLLKLGFVRASILNEAVKYINAIPI